MSSLYVVLIFKAQRSGVIVNIGSIVAISGSSEFPVYSASKGAVHSLTRSLAKALGPYGIRVNCVCPGSIVGTRFLKRARSRPLSSREHLNLLMRIPLRRSGTPKDIASAIYFLASDEAVHVTGAILEVHGGEL